MGSAKVHLAILADIRANLPALEAVLADFDRVAPHGTLVAGDITGGPHAGEVLHRLRSLNACMIRGNGEEYCWTTTWVGPRPSGTVNRFGPACDGHTRS